jgi:type III pantothenate kinase
MSLLLAVDVGNTNLVLGVFDLARGSEAPAMYSWRLATTRERTADEYGLASMELLRHVNLDPARVKDVVISSVVPPLHPVLDAWAHRYFATDPLWIAPGIKTGLKVLIDNPNELGADRIVNVVAGMERYGTPLIAIDFGTGTTFDIVNERKEYLGGLILPGIKIAAEALFQRASRLPRVEIAKPERIIGRNTVQAMQSGLYYGYIGQVNGILERLVKEQPNSQIVATGGLARALAAECPLIKHLDLELTLDGLRLLWLKNRK